VPRLFGDDCSSQEMNAAGREVCAPLMAATMLLQAQGYALVGLEQTKEARRDKGRRAFRTCQFCRDGLFVFFQLPLGRLGSYRLGAAVGIDNDGYFSAFLEGVRLEALGAGYFFLVVLGA